ncbi:MULTISPECIES: YifB family Mg chelatase-like AAA ATPase [unclassified Herbaspirillum]|uniref:YifB family Mg chelatase-like AAA ATPase n=1 Tax=unclassified Herbaspirillum TaxID=2624150 RepID=UPI0011529A83|nr:MULTISPECIES: YifB family Mg chelatase-like AAA ATPase [unclassified Herbaspirillum]MBB5393758.1 magnesium chelatase family protein [Herbaspirillum sp. SJZ102]TQK01380.1 magnesium chelatase family protein [Herbaspirillum sp. SJZ130]TQK05776.1 magnesium chelatase family protein [Herbaspirillum sp. SJZ106]
MSLAVLRSRALAGMRASPVTVEVHLANGLPSFTIVGLPEAEVKEAKDRVRAALQNARFEFPARRITVNLAPADLPKESGRFDLPIALGILAASGQVPGDSFDRYEFAGELSLSGELRPIRGALAMTYAMHHAGGDASSRRAFILPAANADEAALVMDATILPARSLLDVCAHFSSRDEQHRLARHRAAAHNPRPGNWPDFSDVKGQLQAKRALEIAAAGGHSLLLVGPPGTGKSMLAARFPGILPPMSDEQALEAAAVQSLGAGFNVSRWKQRPYRAPHHTASAVALVGGGSTPRPGEISLAHHGVLFLDELPEYSRHVLEVLREPMESGSITISRAARQAEFPARFQLLAAMNPCPCGYFGHESGKCRCTPDAIARYQGRLSGPLLDRIDLQVLVGALAPHELAAAAAGEPSSAIAARTALALDRQQQRQNKPNSRLAPQEIDQHCRPEQAGDELLYAAMARLNWSARAYHRVLKVARTIADLAGAPQVLQPHVAEAIQYRRALNNN